MKTTDLIDMMAQESQAEVRSMRPLSQNVTAAILASSVLLVLFWGIRPDLSTVIIEPLVLVKYLLPALTAMPCLWFASQARRPDSSLNGALRWMLLPLAAVIALVASALVALPSETWLSTIKGETLFACLMSIPVLATPILAAMLWVMRHGASSQPALAGAMAGLASGCLATTVYALHCYEDNPAFYGLWYTAAIVLMGIIGQFLGKRALKW